MAVLLGALVAAVLAATAILVAPALARAASYTSVTLTPSVASPQSAGAPVTWTAVATGCASAEYQF